MIKIKQDLTQFFEITKIRVPNEVLIALDNILDGQIISC